MGGISSYRAVAPVSSTIAAASISHTTVATSDTVVYQNKPAVQVFFSNTTNVAVNVVRLPITIDGQGTTVAGTAGYLLTVPANGFIVLDDKSDGIAMPPSVWKVYADSTPSSGTFTLITRAGQ